MSLIVKSQRNIFTALNGVDEKVTVADDVSLDIDFDQPFSLTGWVKINSLGELHHLFDNYDGIRGFTFGITSTNQFFIVKLDSSATKIRTFSTTTLSTGIWYHLGYSDEGTNSLSGAHLWLNGVEETKVSSTNLPLSSMVNATDLNIGGNVPGTQYLNGFLDEMAVWDVYKDSAGMLDIYNKGRSEVSYLNLPGLVSHWSMDTLNPVDQEGSNDGTSVLMDSSNIIDETNIAGNQGLIIKSQGAGIADNQGLIMKLQ